MADFLRSLSSTGLDRFVRVLGALETRGSEAALQDLERELTEVRGEIREVNELRNTLRLKKEDLAGTIADLDRLVDNGASPDLILLRLVLLDLDAELEAEIAEMRPDGLHKKKAELRKEIARRKLLRRLGSMIGTAARTSSGTP